MEWIASTEEAKWQKCDALSLFEGDKLEITDKHLKPLFGFGCCISELCAKDILELDEKSRKEVLDELFLPQNCGLAYFRLPIGANDFAESWYSLDETAGDFLLKDFSTERDKKYIIPFVKEILARVPDAMFFASPWSPPTWMKYPKACNFGRLVMTEENLSAYASYFRKFIDAYEAEGIKVSQIMPQNEFFSDQKFPSCKYSPDEMERFLPYLIRAVDGKADVWLGTVNAPDLDAPAQTNNKYLNRFMQDEFLRKNIKGVAYQWAGKGAIAECFDNYPELDTINSEWQCGDSRNTWDYAMYGFECFRHYFRFGARANVYWNMALKKDETSTWGWRQNSLLTVDANGYRYNPDFYLVKHLSHFVKRGAVMLETRGKMSSNALVFKNPDNTRVAVLLNPFDIKKTVTLENNSYVLQPRSFNSIVI